MEKHIFLAFDLGATSGRSILGVLENGKVEIKELTRFPNGIIELHGKYYWNDWLVSSLEGRIESLP